MLSSISIISATTRRWSSSSLSSTNILRCVPTHMMYNNTNNIGDATSRQQRRRMSFNFAGPRKLSDIMKTELLTDKSKAEISDIWMTYHEDKENSFGLVLSGKDGQDVLKRAGQCPFFIQPIFRDNGYFMLVSQFQSPSHFLLAYLEDYKMDPHRAQPLITFSVFDDLSESDNLSLVRCDVINKGINDAEGYKVSKNTIDAYRLESEFRRVKEFNHQPNDFDIDDYVSCQNQKWAT